MPGKQRRPLQLGELGGAFQERAIGGNRPSAPVRSRTFAGHIFRPGRRSLTSSPTSPGESFSKGASMSSMLAARRNSKPWYIIDPRRSRTFLPGWDLLTTFCLIFTAIVTPFEVAFLKLPETASEALSDPLFLVNRIIDLTFAFDLVLNFLLMYQDTSALDGVKWIDEPSAIVKHYLRGWFALDLFSVLPSAFDLLPYMLESSSASGARMDEGEDILTRFKFLRVVRCLRLVKLMRLLRASRMMSRWETRLSINYNMASMCKGARASLERLPGASGFSTACWEPLASPPLARCSMCRAHPELRRSIRTRSVLVGYLLVAHWSACALVLPTTFYDHPVTRRNLDCHLRGVCRLSAIGLPTTAGALVAEFVLTASDGF